MATKSGSWVQFWLLKVDDPWSRFGNSGPRLEAKIGPRGHFWQRKIGQGPTFGSQNSTQGPLLARSSFRVTVHYARDAWWYFPVSNKSHSLNLWPYRLLLNSLIVVIVYSKHANILGEVIAAYSVSTKRWVSSNSTVRFLQYSTRPWDNLLLQPIKLKAKSS